jgi:hypothetical protein
MSLNTVKPIYKELGYNETYRLHRLHRFLNEMIGFYERFRPHRPIRYKGV